MGIILIFWSFFQADIQEIYDLHQRELIQRSKKAFQELLLERADLFYQFRSSPMATVTQNDILDITEALQEDSRWDLFIQIFIFKRFIWFQTTESFYLYSLHCVLRLWV